ncbi:hypothetical protein Tco_1456279 [Tanacetum coccineum]
MSMTIQSSVKDKILATSSETSKVENAPAEMLRDLTNKWKREQMMVVLYGLNCIVSMSMKFATIQYGVRRYDIGCQSRSEAVSSKRSYRAEERLNGNDDDRYLIMKAHAINGTWYIRAAVKTYFILESYNSKEWNSGDDQLRFRWMIYFVVLADAVESVSDAIRFELPVLWAEIGESSLIGPELVQETTDKVVLIKEKLKAARDRQKSCADNRRKPLEFEVGERVMLKVSPWKGVIRFGKKGSVSVEIAERNLTGVHDTYHVSNLKYDWRMLHDHLIGIGFMLDFVEFISFTFGDKEMILWFKHFSD